MNLATTNLRLRAENRHFAGTGGISQNNRALGFQPGFQDTESGQMDLARFADGMRSPVHILDGVPAEWVTRRDSAGRVKCVKPSVVSGFIRDGRFYTREQTATLLS